MVKCNTNIFTTTGATQNKYIGANGQEQNGVYQEYSFAYTNYLKVKPNTTYTISGVSKVSNVTNHSVSAWDSNKTFIDRLVNLKFPGNSIGQEYSVTFTTTAETEYIMFNYVYTVDEEMKIYLNDYTFNEIYTDGTTETVEITGKNLFDKNAITEGYIYNAQLEYVESNIGSLSDYIPVVAGQPYTFTGHKETSGNFNIRINYFDANKEIQSQDVQPIGMGNYNFTITMPSGIKYLRYSFRTEIADSQQVELGETATAYEPYFNGGTANAEMLLSVGDYKDVQSVIDGGVTRNIGIKVLDGTENFKIIDGTYPYFCIDYNTDFSLSTNIHGGFCSHFECVNTGATRNEQGISLYRNSSTNATRLGLKYNDLYPATSSNIPLLKQWLSDQYANGTPVIIVYSLNTPTEETVTPQPMNIQAGTNIVQITQASMDDLELEVKYKAGVSVTITEIENAQLDDNVEVTING